MNQSTNPSPLAANIRAAVGTFESLLTLEPALNQAAELVARCLGDGHKVLACGNGGSSADAAHLVAELVGRYKKTRRPYPAISLSDCAGVMTCIANDFGYEEVFARQVRGLAQSGDVLVVFTTSGASRNVTLALDAARELGIASVAFLGKTGGICKGKASVELLIPNADTARIQEAHQLLFHSLCDLTERALGHL